MKRKITEISVYEFFMCMFVIAIHLLSEGVDAFPKWSAVSITFLSLTKLMTFAVPGFVFTSAIKLFYKYGDRNFNYPKFLLGRFLRIYLPYIAAVCIYYIVFVYLLELDGFHEFDLNELLGFILRGDISAQFYFVILIVQFYLLMPLWLLIIKAKSKTAAVISVLVSLAVTLLSRMYFPQLAAFVLEHIKALDLPFANPAAEVDIPSTMRMLGGYTNKVFTSYIVFWFAGMYIGISYEKITDAIIRNRPVIYLGWLILAVSHCILSYMSLGGIIRYTLEPVVVVMFCLFSIFGFYIYANNLTVSLERMGKGFLSSIAGASYDIYLIHCLIITIVSYYLGHFEVESVMARFWISAGITYSVSIILCVLKTTLQTNIKLSHHRRSAAKSRKTSRRKRYL